MLEITVHHERLVLLADRAVWWPARGTLLIADTHFGKPASFRAAGIPVPENITDRDVARMASLISQHAPERLIVLGDFLHAASGRTDESMAALAAWRAAASALSIILIRGNHDRSAGDPPDDWNIQCVTGPLCIGPFAFVHEPEHVPDHYTFAGHLHPGLSMGMPSRSSFGRKSAGGRLRAACYWFGSSIAVLPAFGSFTGLAMARPVEGDRLYAIGEDEVVEVPTVIAAS